MLPKSHGTMSFSEECPIAVAINAPCEHETGKAIWWSANHPIEVGAQLGGRRHAVDIEAHAFGVSFGRAREVGDEAVQIFGRERANAKLRGSSVTETHMIQHWQGGTL